MAGTPSLFAGIGFQFFDNNGNPLSGGKVYSYLAGTTTSVATYTTETANVAHPNPIILDSAGKVPSGGEIWLREGDASYYKFVLATSSNVVLNTYDYVPGTYSATDLSNTTDPTKGDALVGFRQSNSSGNLTNAVGRTVHQKLQEFVSVKDFGATGDGTTNDTTAIQNAASATGQSGTLYFPTGTYRIASNLTINTNVNFDGAQVTVDSAVTLTINGMVCAALEQIFDGSGSVVVSKKTPIIFPEWWGAAQDNLSADSEPGITAAISNSASQSNTIYFSGKYAIGSTITVLNTTEINSDRSSSIRPLSGSGVTNGIIMGAGNALGRFVMPTLVGFSGVALEVRCNLANIYVPQFNSCGICIKFNSGHSGVTANILDTVVEFDAISSCTTAMNVNHNFAADVVQGCGVKGNFITNTINAVIFSGVSVSGKNDGLFLDVLAIDFVDGGGAFLNNQTGYAISRFTATVRSWFGGNGFSAGTPTQFVLGSWNGCVVDIVNARGFNQTNFTPDLLKASTIKFRAWVSRAGALQMVPLSSGLAGFNGGFMMYQTHSVMKVVLAADVLAGATAAYYFWHVAGDGDYYPWKMIRVDGGTGLIVESIHDQSSVEDGRVAVTLRNISASTVDTGTTAYFYLERTA